MTEREWQIASGSFTAHVINPDQNWGEAPSRGKPGYRASGPRALCGRYPQRNNDYAFALSVGTPERDLRSAFGPPYRRCEGCQDALDQEGRDAR